MTETVSVAGVFPLLGVTESQLPEVTAAVKLSGAPVLAMLTLWLAGAEPPMEKERAPSRDSRRGPHSA